MENGDQPATKRDVQEAVQASKTEILEILQASVQASKSEVLEAMRDMQTELLKAFYSYGQTTDLKMKDSELADFSARQRLTAVESRITEVERRLNTPPQR